MSHHPDDEASAELDPVSSRCLARTRSMVLNVLVADALSVLATALILRRWNDVDFEVDRGQARNVLFGGLFLVFACVLLVLRGLGGRERLADPGRRCLRFTASRVGAAAVGWLAMPLGLAYGLVVDPSLRGVAPFWLAAAVAAKLAYSHAVELADFDEPPIDPEPPPS